MKKKLDDYLLPIITFILVIGIWEAVVFIYKIQEIILPAPHRILSSIVSNFNTLLYHTSITSFEAIIGFLIGSFVSILIAVIFVHLPRVKKSFYPYAIILQATPVLALAPLLILWFGNGVMSKIVMAALVAFFPVLVGAVKGFGSIKEGSIDLFNSIYATKSQLFFKLRLPSSLKFIFPALKISATFAVIGATIAEFTGASKGIGYLIINSSYYLDTSLMFSSIIMISLVGIALFYFIDYLERNIVFWDKES
jgi:NitT/TauT family transport system permease protein